MTTQSVGSGWPVSSTAHRRQHTPNRAAWYASQIRLVATELIKPIARAVHLPAHDETPAVIDLTDTAP